jgi:hypothetical protein
MAKKLKKLRDKWLVIGLVLTAVFGLAACGGGSSSSTSSAPSVEGDGPVGLSSVSEGSTRLNAVLSGNQISALSGGPVATAAGGSGTLTLSADRTAIDFTLDAGALSTFNSPVITGVHIHVRNPGLDNGPIIFDFLPATVPDPLVLSGTLTAANLIPRPPTVPDFPAAVAALLNGTTYFQVHTQAHPAGELRGHIGTEILTSTLNGAQITVASRGPVATAATGTGMVVVSPDQNTASVMLDIGQAANFNGIITAAHIHAGAAGANGPIIFDFALPAVIPANPVINVVLTAADLSPAQTAITTFAEAVDALLSGNTYFQVHSTAHPGGEIRGQILPVQ